MDNKLFDKVENGLQQCGGTALFLGHCPDACPYKKDAETSDECIEALLADALILIRAQKPRVMTLEEIENAEVVWFEARKHLYVEPILTRGKAFQDADWFRYGRDWRCWTSRPTNEQREMTAWTQKGRCCDGNPM